MVNERDESTERIRTKDQRHQNNSHMHWRVTIYVTANNRQQDRERRGWRRSRTIEAWKGQFLSLLFLRRQFPSLFFLRRQSVFSRCVLELLLLLQKKVKTRQQQMKTSYGHYDLRLVWEDLQLLKIWREQDLKPSFLALLSCSECFVTSIKCPNRWFHPPSVSFHSWHYC